MLAYKSYLTYFIQQKVNAKSKIRIGPFKLFENLAIILFILPAFIEFFHIWSYHIEIRYHKILNTRLSILFANYLKSFVLLQFAKNG